MKRIVFLICAVVCALLVGPVGAQKKSATKEAELKRLIELKAKRRALEAAQKAAILEELKAKAEARALELKRLDAIKGRRGRPVAPATVKPKSSVGGQPTNPVAVPKADSKKFALTLADDTKLIGEPVGLAKVGIKTTFGIAQVPLEVIQKIESVKNASIIKIHFRNGDVVSGELQANELRFKTTYGVVKFAANQLVRMQWGTRFTTQTSNVSRKTPVQYAPVPRGRFRDRFGGGAMPIRGGFAPGGGFGAVPDSPFK